MSVSMESFKKYIDIIQLKNSVSYLFSPERPGVPQLVY